MPDIYNRRYAGVPPGAVYVGRPTEFGNPFLVRFRTSDLHQAHASCVRTFREWIMGEDREELRLRIRQELRGKDLVCWCAPLPCHAEVLREIANAAL